MAARNNPYHSEETRKRIQTSQLLNRLTAFALGQDDPTSKKPVEMAPHAVTAALGMLKKVLPDLQATTISGDPDRPLNIKPDLSHLSEEQLRVLSSIKPKPGV